ncbi:MAG: hypothetical protein AB7F38_00160 [Piscinibacter sp.]
MLLKSVALGLGAALAALIISNLFSSSGVKLRTEAWPASAKAILFERPTVPLSADQWRRIEKTLQEAGNNANPSHLVAAVLRRAWPLVLLFAFVAFAAVRWLLKDRTLSAAAAATAPSALLLFAAFAHTHPYYP